MYTSVLFGLFACGIIFYMMLLEYQRNDHISAIYLAVLLGVLIELTAIAVSITLSAAPPLRSPW